MGVKRVSMENLLTCSVSFVKLQDLLEQLISSTNNQDTAIKFLQDTAARNEERLRGQDSAMVDLRKQQMEMMQRTEQAVALHEEASGRSQQLELQLGELGERLLASEQRFGPLERRVAGAEAKQVEAGKYLEVAHATLTAQSAHVERLREAMGDTTPHPELQGAGAVAGGAAGELAPPAQTPRGTLLERLAELEAKIDGLSLLEPSVSSLKEVAEQTSTKLEHHTEQLRQLVPEVEASQAGGGRQHPLGAGLDDRVVAALASDLQRLDAGQHSITEHTKTFSRKFEEELSATKVNVAELAACLKEILDRGASATSKCLSCHSDRKQIETPVLMGMDGKVYRPTSGRSGAVTPVEKLSGSDKLTSAVGPPAVFSRSTRVRPKSASASRRHHLRHSASDGTL